ncbi:hypothetical protein K0M31_017149 [Melipona bicolor]|uniref:Uncharacterized protein n=1 Tax=Melipona bicolor TaxID=60889 RepID=A0AA40FDE5_9HYME|nr:hypothetical protein K0M31_017149 [Melipona bicolor]
MSLFVTAKGLMRVQREEEEEKKKKRESREKWILLFSSSDYNPLVFLAGSYVRKDDAAMPLAGDSVDYFFYLAPINYELGATDFS